MIMNQWDKYKASSAQGEVGRFWFHCFLTLLVSGEDESGKTTLMARLQHTEDPKKGHALEYHYLNVRDEDRDGKSIMPHGLKLDFYWHVYLFVCNFAKKVSMQK